MLFYDQRLIKIMKYYIVHKHNDYELCPSRIVKKVNNTRENELFCIEVSSGITYFINTRTSNKFNSTYSHEKWKLFAQTSSLSWRLSFAFCHEKRDSRSDRRQTNLQRNSDFFPLNIFLQTPYRFFGSRRLETAQKIHSANPDLSVTDYRTTQSSRIQRFRLRCEVELSTTGHFVTRVIRIFYSSIKSFRSLP